MTASQRSASGAIPFWRRKLTHQGVLSALAAAAIVAVPVAADARITKVTIGSKESPTFGGYSWPGVGQYEKIVGIAYGELDPNDPHNAVITDIKLAPRNAAGRVEYSHAFYIVKPIDLAKGNHKMVYDVVNRGVLDPRTCSIAAPQPTISPRSPTRRPCRRCSSSSRGLHHCGERMGLFRRHEHGQQQPVDPAADRQERGRLVHHRTGVRVHRGQRRARWISRMPPPRSTSRRRSSRIACISNDAPQTIPATGWNYNSSGTAISLRRRELRQPTTSTSSATRRRIPRVNGIGFAAMRDFVTWMKFDAKDDFTTANPLAGDILRVYTINRSQPARMLNDFRTLGFNASEGNRKVFDAMLNWVGAFSGINMNYRFSNPGTTQRNRQDQLYTEAFFPFANETITDHISGITAGRYDRCTATNTCPLAMEVYSSNEYWVKAASLGHTNHAGHRRPSGSSADPQLPHLEPSAFQPGQRQLAGNLPAVRQSAGVGTRSARVVGSDGCVVHERRRAAAEPDSALRGRHPRPVVAAERLRLPEHSGRDLYRPQVDALSLQLRPQFLRDGHPDDLPAGGFGADLRQPCQRPDLSELRAEGRRGRQRDRRHPAA